GHESQQRDSQNPRETLNGLENVCVHCALVFSNQQSMNRSLWEIAATAEARREWAVLLAGRLAKRLTLNTSPLKLI
ncbi:MAG: hypothetical protein KJZ79_03290, partial [Bryobacteraceae bacterium]|nr:hypothetical protein [Bryobacteraceae bacterium]